MHINMAEIKKYKQYHFKKLTDRLIGSLQLLFTTQVFYLDLIL